MNFDDIGSLMCGFDRKLNVDVESETSMSEEKPYTPGQIADAIEKGGCYGFDDYGRFIDPGVNSRLAEKIKSDALEVVADTYSAYLKTRDHERYLEEFFEYDARLLRYGWPEDRNPEFGKLEPIAPHPPKKRGPGANTQAILLKGLVRLANENTDFKFDLDWLFNKAGFPDMNERNELSKLRRALGEDSMGEAAMANILRQLGRRR